MTEFERRLAQHPPLAMQKIRAEFIQVFGKPLDELCSQDLDDQLMAWLVKTPGVSRPASR